MTLKKFTVSLSILGSLGLFAACGSSQDANGKVLGADGQEVPAAFLPEVDGANPNDPNHINLALKIVSYKDDAGKPVLSKDQMPTVLKQMNAIMKPCNMSYRIEKVEEVNPKDMGLPFHPSSMGDLDPIRSKFDENKYLVVVNTGSWSLPANAWTAMPGQTPSGAVLEAVVADSAGIMAHELGHYLNLDHVSDTADLMNPIIYDSSTKLEDWQCTAMRQAAMTVRAEAIRHA
jgi:hypothetical protein